MPDDAVLTLRIQHLEDHLQKDASLLKRYEDALRLESDPRRQVYFEESIASLRTSLETHQREYDELTELLRVFPSTNKRTCSTEIDLRLRRINSQIQELSTKVEVMHSDVTQKLEDLIENIVFQITAHLTDEQTSSMQSIEWALQQNRLPSGDLEDLLYETQEVLLTAEIPPENTHILAAKEVIDAPHIDMAHKIKVVIPLVPFLLSYEGELGLKNSLNLKNLWGQLRSKFLGNHND